MLPGRSSFSRWPVPASLFLEDVDDLLKRLFALSVAQDISSLEKYGSIILEFNRNGGELPSTLQFCHEVAHVGGQGFKNYCLLILLDHRKNLCLQFLPAWWLTRAGSRLRSRASVLLVNTFSVIVAISRAHCRPGFVKGGCCGCRTSLAILITAVKVVLTWVHHGTKFVLHFLSVFDIVRCSSCTIFATREALLVYLELRWLGRQVDVRARA